MAVMPCECSQVLRPEWPCLIANHFNYKNQKYIMGTLWFNKSLMLSTVYGYGATRHRYRLRDTESCRPTYYTRQLCEKQPVCRHHRSINRRMPQRASNNDRIYKDLSLPHIGPVSLAVRLCVISDFRSPSIIARIF